MPLLRASDIKIRDPFVLPVAAEQIYYLYGTTDKNPWGGHPGEGFDTYRSRDLIHWEGPFPAFRPPPSGVHSLKLGVILSSVRPSVPWWHPLVWRLLVLRGWQR